MAIKLPERNYFTFSELMTRWDCTENDLRFAIISGAIKPSIKLNGEHYCVLWKINGFGEYNPDEFNPNSTDSYRLQYKPRRWLYLQDPVQISPFDCEFKFVSDDRNPDKGEPCFSIWHSLPVPLSMDRIKNDAVFLLEEVARYEAEHGTEVGAAKAEATLSARERNSLLTIIAALCDYSDMDIRARGAAGQIVKMTEELGAPVTDDTIRKVLKQIPDALETRFK
jgi:hypothetical protein